MFHDFTYPAILAASTRGAWQLDDVLPPGASSISPARSCPKAWRGPPPSRDCRSDAERLTLNHIRGHDYLSRCSAWSRSSSCRSCSTMPGRCLSGDDWRVRALLNFASARKPSTSSCSSASTPPSPRLRVECEVIGPSEAIGAEVLATTRSASPGHPDDRMDDAEPLSRQRPRRRRPRSLVRACCAATGSRRRSTPSSTR
jgi:hypothetical protein